jgi:ankyrin repeat protein
VSFFHCFFFQFLFRYATINNRKAMVKLLDSFGADLSAADVRGLTALHYAYYYG